MATNVGKVGIVMKGAYNSSNAYEVLDAVTYNSGLYIAKKDAPAGTTPTNTNYWQQAINTVDIHRENISVTVSADAASPLGYYGSQNINELVTQYGSVIGVWSRDPYGYPALATYYVSSNNNFVAVTAKSAPNNTITVQVAFAK